MLRLVFVLLCGVAAHQSLRAPTPPTAPALAPKAVEAPAPAAAKVEEKKVEAPAPVAAKVEEPKVEAPAVLVKVEEPKVEAAKVEEPKVEEPKVEEAPVETPAVLVKADVPAEEAKVEVPAEEAKVEVPAEEAKVEVPAEEAAAAPAVEAPVEAKAEEPTEAPAVLASSAADVYGHVNFLLNRMEANAKARNDFPAEEEIIPAAQAPAEEPAAAVEAPVEAKVEEPAPVAASAEEPKVEAPAPVAAKVEEPKVEAAKVEEPKVEEPKVEVPKVEVAVPEPESTLDSTLEKPKAMVHRSPLWEEAPKEEEKPAPAHQVMTKEEKREQSFPKEWIKNDVKFNSDKDVMQSREEDLADQVAEQAKWNTKSESWIQTKSLALRSWGAMHA